MQIKHGEQQQFIQVYKKMLEFKSSKQWRLLQGLSSLKTVTTNKKQNKENQTTKEPSCMQHRINTIRKTLLTWRKTRLGFGLAISEL